MLIGMVIVLACVAVFCATFYVTWNHVTNEESFLGCVKEYVTDWRINRFLNRMKKSAFSAGFFFNDDGVSNMFFMFADHLRYYNTWVTEYSKDLEV